MKSIIAFLKEAYEEFQRVKFPGKDETIRLTAYVIGVSLATGLFVAGMDYVFKEALRMVL